eukprot:7095930-Pyramimonas_sp.AAC.1
MMGSTRRSAATSSGNAQPYPPRAGSLPAGRRWLEGVSLNGCGKGRREVTTSDPWGSWRAFVATA